MKTGQLGNEDTEENKWWKNVRPLREWNIPAVLYDPYENTTLYFVVYQS